MKKLIEILFSINMRGFEVSLCNFNSIRNKRDTTETSTKHYTEY